jgi:hypothetical protein
MHHDITLVAYGLSNLIIDGIVGIIEIYGEAHEMRKV